jgi:hypothetical protein
MGSGTTAAAAHELGLRWTGIEKEERYVQIIRDRLHARGSDFLVSPNPTLLDIVEEESSLEQAARYLPRPEARGRAAYRSTSCLCP